MMRSESGTQDNIKKTSIKRGFAAMSKERQREISRMGGRAAHAKGKAHVFTSEEARIAGRKGGISVSRDRAHMAAIGRKGGENRRLRKLFKPAID